MFKITPSANPWKLCAVALLALLAAVLCSRIDHPWTYNDDYNGAFWSQAARNLDRVGLFATAGVPAPLYFGQPPIPRDALYVHHPTLLALMAALDRAILGDSEWAARCLPVFFSILTATLLWLVVSEAFGWRGGAFVLALFVAAPMELHYGQMENFEAPELFFLLAALSCLHLWRRRGSTRAAAGLLIFCALAMWTDWQGYLLVIILAARCLLRRGGRDVRMAGGLLLVAFLSGMAFLAQIGLAMPGAWRELFTALRERSSHADLSGTAFTMSQWLNTEFGYLTSFYHPLAWCLALAGAAMACFQWRQLFSQEKAVLETGALLFLMDTLYICGLRNQSYIHDFASFYFLVPVAVFGGFFIERMARRFAWPAAAAGGLCAGVLIWLGIRGLANIDTPFCILDDDDTEPAMLMPDLGRLIDRSFPEDAVVICNFDQYYSPLPFYARREMVNDRKSYADWRQAMTDASPEPVGGVIWTGATGATELLGQLPAAEMRPVTRDGVRFVLWRSNWKKAPD